MSSMEAMLFGSLLFLIFNLKNSLWPREDALQNYPADTDL